MSSKQHTPTRPLAQAKVSTNAALVAAKRTLEVGYTGFGEPLPQECQELVAITRHRVQAALDALSKLDKYATRTVVDHR